MQRSSCHFSHSLFSESRDDLGGSAQWVSFSGNPIESIAFWDTFSSWDPRVSVSAGLPEPLCHQFPFHRTMIGSYCLPGRCLSPQVQIFQDDTLYHWPHASLCVKTGSFPAFDTLPARSRPKERLCLDYRLLIHSISHSAIHVIPDQWVALKQLLTDMILANELGVASSS